MQGIEYKPYVIEMDYLFPPSLADFLGTTDEVYVFREVTEQLDTFERKKDYFLEPLFFLPLNIPVPVK